MVQEEGVEVDVGAVKEHIWFVGDAHQQERDLNVVLWDFEGPERFLLNI